MLLGDVIPDLEVETSVGKMKLYDYMGSDWLLLCSHPADYTPVCTTELGRLAVLQPEFEKRGVKVMALSCDSAESHQGWLGDINKNSGCSVSYPIIADESREVAKAFGMLQTEGFTLQGLPATVRSVFVIGNDHKVKMSLTYPASTGRNFDEILRVVDSLKLTADKSVATPVDWKAGDECVILPSVSNDAAKEKFPNGWKTVDLPSGKEYLRLVKVD
uniref:Thioredoxin domain-containing protein n=1 Tax=Timspurckia oligopyrenoides TaxID=708627 RepID=A0A7S0ZDE0_9RHOD|mmetsp:Transcript_13504/g.24224  ORF Transcript_13504/g.24224 Transcript_13504/m.24224 type:complete len:217 (+) Transcript_13504:116-766(+)